MTVRPRGSRGVAGDPRGSGVSRARSRSSGGTAARVAVLAVAALLAACGAAGTGRTLQDCEARFLGQPRTTFLPACVDTTRGAMLVEAEYLAGVVECELGNFVDAPAALEAQAVAARTYLAIFLQERGEDAVVPLGPSFQCWTAPARPSSIAAARATTDVVMHHRMRLISANYAAGTRRLDAECAPHPPEDSGYDFETWDAMRADFREARAEGRWPRYGGTDWTEVLVTRNAGRSAQDVEPTALAHPVPHNRGALGQNTARCLARAGHDAVSILRYFYGEDVRFSSPPEAAGVEVALEER